MNPMLARLALAGILAVAEKNDKRTPEQRAEDAGYDAGRNMPNTTNCHFAHFATPEQTKAWERGKKRGDAEREATEGPAQGGSR